MKPNLNDIKALIEQAKKLKQEVEQLKKKSFLTPVQSEAIKAGKTGTDIALYLLRLSYTNEEECENNFGIVDSYFTLTESLNSGRFAQNLGDRHADDYGEKPERIEWYDPNKHTGLFARYDFDEKKFRHFLNQYTAKQRQLYWKKHIQPLIIQLDTDLTPWLPFMKPYIDTEGIQEAIKTAEPATISDAIYEFKKIQKVVETEEKQESAETEQGEKSDDLLDSKILNLARRRIKVKFAERRKALSEEVERIMCKLGREGSARSSGAFKLVRDACDSEIDIKANIVWGSIQDVLNAVGLSITETPATALKQEVGHHIEAIVEEVSEYMTQRLPMSKSDAHYFDFENAKREVKEKFDVAIDLYVNSLTNKPAGKGQENKAINKPNGKSHKILGDKFEVWGLSINYKNLWHKIKNRPCVARGIKKIRKLFRR